MKLSKDYYSSGQCSNKEVERCLKAIKNKEPFDRDVQNYLVVGLRNDTLPKRIMIILDRIFPEAKQALKSLHRLEAKLRKYKTVNIRK